MEHKKDLLVNILLAFTALVLSLLLIEACLRLYFLVLSPLGKDIDHFMLRSNDFFYSPHPYLIHTFNPSVPSVNSLGLINREVGIKGDGVYRIVCLGGSTTAEGYPLHLESLLKKRYASKRIEVVNAGVPAWTSQENVINLVINLLDLEPDLLIIHQGVNDLNARCGPDFRVDYSHYRKIWVRGWSDTILDKTLFIQDYSYLYRIVVFKLTRRIFAIQYLTETKAARDACSKINELDPKTAKPFIRNTQVMIDLANARGINVILSTQAYNQDPEIMEKSRQRGLNIEEMNEFTRELARKNNVALVDIEDHMSGDFDYFPDLVHMNEEGQKLKAKYFSDKIVEEDFIQSVDTPQ